MNILFINGSPNKEGNTARLAENRFYGPVWKKICIPVSGGGAGKVDDGKSGVHNEPFCAYVRHGVCRDGGRQ